MNVYLTFDIEVWCQGWQDLDAHFPRCFERYVYGKSQHGQYALPATLEILARYQLPAIFFVEPLFAARFGLSYLQQIVDLIQAHGHQIELHLHPEWVDEISPPPLRHIPGKRQHLVYYSLEEQTQLLALGKALLQQVGVDPISAFRAGSYAANADTYTALAHNQIYIDSSLNGCYPISGQGFPRDWIGRAYYQQGEVCCYPVSLFLDGFKRLRPAQVNACALPEFQALLQQASRLGQSDLVIVSHNFELLKPNSSEPDWCVVKRFEALCQLLQQQQSWSVAAKMPPSPPQAAPSIIPAIRPMATLSRYSEQLLRRLG